LLSDVAAAPIPKQDLKSIGGVGVISGVIGAYS